MRPLLITVACKTKCVILKGLVLVYFRCRAKAVGLYECYLTQRDQAAVKVNLKQSGLVVVVSMLVDQQRHLMMKAQQAVDVVTRRTGDGV